MRQLFTILIIFQALNLFGQIDNNYREPFLLKLALDSVGYLEQKIDRTPYFVKENELQIYPGEKLFIEFDITDNVINSVKLVEENEEPRKTIVIEFNQERKSNEGNYMVLQVSNPFQQELLYSAFIYTHEGQKWEKTTILPIAPNSFGYEIWDEVIIRLSISNWKLYPKENIETNKPRSIDSSTSKKLIAETRKWVKEHGVKLNKLHLADPEEINYTCDSSLYLKQVRGDTVRYWTYGTRVPIETGRASEWLKRSTYGKTCYFKEINWNGKLTGVNLIPHTFYFRNDSIFELQKFYKISYDSLISILTLRYSEDHKEDVKYYTDLIEFNSYEQFKLIYHPDLFSEGAYEGNDNNDKITLRDEWICNNKRYFALEIENSWSGEKRTYTLVFDENNRWLEYDGCDQIGNDCLNKRKFKVHYR